MFNNSVLAEEVNVDGNVLSAVNKVIYFCNILKQNAKMQCNINNRYHLHRAGSLLCMVFTYHSKDESVSLAKDRVNETRFVYCR